MKSTKNTQLQKLDEFIYANTRGSEKILNNGKISFTSEQAADQIISQTGSSTWNGKKVFEKEASITYSFSNDTSNSKFGVFTEAQKIMAEQQLARWSDVANITFTKVAFGEKSDLIFRTDKETSSAGYSSYPNPGNSVYVNMADKYFNTWFNNSDQTQARHLVQHEVGHALGLAHPTNSKNVTDYYESDSAYSEMKGNHQSQIYPDIAKNALAMSIVPKIDDTTALQKLYGANYATRSDDTIYGFNSNTNDKAFLIESSSKKVPIFSIWDGGGNDTLDFSGYKQDQSISLQAGSLSSVGGLKGNIGIDENVTIENAIGGSGNDIIVGNNVSNELHGGAGNDIIYGAGGADTLYGGVGADIFIYTDASDSNTTQTDIIKDFVSDQDKIDVSALLTNANLSSSLNFVSAFTGHAGDAVLSYNANNQLTSFGIDLSGSNAADFLVDIVGQPTANDIVIA
ncbi:M10 family metallopeptidase C-terminal domain-containing protein [Pseudomonas chlororaphis]|uniref:M10 family metallopeptidase C-terminal domain-containing protein n=1 Tax=Pseudomonas chlororaphis TaxID=587753 RepID=UPI0009B8E97E|nr:M10 family metallopeptidase C-terminal domain-containing protein [Pseudomonas chlororaphis]